MDPIQTSNPQVSNNGVLLVFFLVILAIIAGGGYYFAAQKNLNQESEEEEPNNIITPEKDKLMREYFITAPAELNRLKQLASTEGEQYLKLLGFTAIEGDKYNLAGESLDGFFATCRPYQNLSQLDNVKIIFKNDEIIDAEISFVYLEDDMKLVKVQKDLAAMMSAFNGYEIKLTNLEEAYSIAKDKLAGEQLGRGSSEYKIGNITIRIDVIISKPQEFALKIYIFKVSQSVHN